jgi:phosphoadenosine phosphosulfate reductase
MAYFKENEFKSDTWHLKTAPGPIETQSILPLKLWQEASDFQANLELGLLLEPGDNLASICKDLQRFSLIAISFPKFTDGRGYSMAYEIRKIYGFTGELRATGDVLFDQLQFMFRSGFDAFEIKDPATLKLLEQGRRPDMTRFYQPGLQPETPADSRPWARRLA